MNNNLDLKERIKSLAPAQQELLIKKLSEAKQSSGLSQVPMSEKVKASFAQRSLWLTNQVEGANPKYNMFSAYAINGALNMEGLSQSIDIIVRRHDALRTTFEEEGGVIYQKVNTDTKVGLDLRSWENDKLSVSDSELQLRIKNIARQLFCLQNGPLCKFILIKLAENQHIFVMNIHHIIYDGWSKSILMRELATLYESFIAEQEGSSIGAGGWSDILGEQPYQYRDYADWESKNINVEKKLAYWKERLADIPQFLSLPYKKDYSEIASDIEKVVINEKLKAGLASIARETCSTEYMVMLCLFSIVLSRLSCEEDILVGAPIDNRDKKELQNIVGYFLDTAVFRNKIDIKKTYRELILEVKASSIATYKNQGAPWDQIISELHPDRNTGHSPIFQAMLVFQNPNSHGFQLPGVEIKKIDSGTNTTKYDLYLTFAEIGKQFEGWLTYNKQLLSEETVSNILDALELTIEAAVTDADSIVANTALTTQSAGGANAVLDVRKDYYTSFQSLFENIVKSKADEDAIISQGKTLTFAELDLYANRVCKVLREKGAKRGDVIGISLERSNDQVLSILACLKLGLSYMPLNPRMPEERLNYYIAEAQPKLVIGSEQQSFSFSRQENSCYIEGIYEEDFVDEKIDVHCSVPLDIAYIIFTSGSTGLPKGVAGTHKGLINRLSWMWTRYPYEENEVLCYKTTSNFVDSVAELWGPLLQGRPVYVCSDDEVIDLFSFVDVLREKGITRLVLVPSLLRSLLEHYPELDDELPELKIVVSSGEALQKDLVEKLYDAAPQAKLINIYGSTEVSADCTYYEVGNAESIDVSVPVGYPLPNSAVYILDEYLNECPIGIEGEIYVSGEVLSLGYVNSPVMTAERFIPNAMDSLSSRMFRTGDRGKYLSDKAIQYLSRNDLQIKIRGIRIDLMEIEAAILSHESVVKAACIVKDNDQSGGQICAYIVAEEELPVTPKQMRAYLSEKIPAYMLPTQYRFLNELPILSSGKVDKKVLESFETEIYVDELAVLPRNDVESFVYEVWESLLNINGFGVADNYFDLGGNSLAALQIVVKIREKYAIDITPRKIFELMTVENIAMFIEKAIEISKLMQKEKIESSDQNELDEESEWTTVKI